MKRALEGLDGMMRAFGRELADLRRFRGLSQEALAEATGLSVNTVGNLERGSLDPTVVVVALVQIQLGSVGLELAEDHFRPIAPPPSQGPLPFPNLVLPAPAIVLTIGKAVRTRREALGLTRDALATASGVHVNTLSNLEQGLVAPTTSTLFRVYLALGVKRVVGTPDGIALE
jgi:transcriptional regulator with XRE-family HTH domain